MLNREHFEALKFDQSKPPIIADDDLNEDEMINEIQVDENGNCTVIGVMAHALWKSGGFPRSRCSLNNYYIYGYNELPQGQRWEVEGWGPYRHEIEVGPNQVLVNLKNAPFKV